MPRVPSYRDLSPSPLAVHQTHARTDAHGFPSHGHRANGDPALGAGVSAAPAYRTPPGRAGASGGLGDDARVAASDATAGRSNVAVSSARQTELVNQVMQAINARATRKSGWNLRRPFLRFDANGDRMLSHSELASCLRALGVQHDAATVRAVMAAFDKNGDGHIDFGEFLFQFMNRRKLVRQWRQEGGLGADDETKRTELRRYLVSFTAPDKRGDADGRGGSLTRLELQVALSKKGVPLNDWETDAMLDSLEKASSSGAGQLPTRIPVEFIIEFLCSDDDGQFEFGKPPALADDSAFATPIATEHSGLTTGARARQGKGGAGAVAAVQPHWPHSSTTVRPLSAAGAGSRGAVRSRR